jgi:energy-converting hydrogenase Eha subunit A
MKQKDLALIIVIIIVSAVISLFVSRLIFKSAAHQQQAVVVQPITGNFERPAQAYFNSSSIDPTKVISIGQSANPNPF